MEVNLAQRRPFWSLLCLSAEDISHLSYSHKGWHPPLPKLTWGAPPVSPALTPHTAAAPANVTHVVPAVPTQDSSKAEFCADPTGLPGDLLPPCPVAQLFFSL